MRRKEDGRCTEHMFYGLQEGKFIFLFFIFFGGGGGWGVGVRGLSKKINSITCWI
jgi:hypothetical protein